MRAEPPSRSFLKAPPFREEINFERGRIKGAAEVTGGAGLDYAPLKPSHLERWLAARLPDPPSSPQTERNNLPPYFTSFFFLFYTS